MTRRISLVLALTVVLLLGLAPVAVQGSHGTPPEPNRIALPDGFGPEGITAGPDHTFFVGSLVNGAIYRGNLDSGLGAIFVPGAAGRLAAGTFYEEQNDRLWVAGGNTHEVRVYNGSTGALLATYTFAGGFLNDVVVTKGVAYVTDSQNRWLDVIPLGKGDALPAQSGTRTLPLSGDFQLLPGFNANGIALGGKWLVIVQSAAGGGLFRVDPATGVTRKIDLGGYAVTNGDGIEIHGRTIYVIRNFDNLVAVLKVDGSFEVGELLGEIKSPGNLDVPTTGILEGSRLWVVNARFGTTDPQPARYWITELSTKL